MGGYGLAGAMMTASRFANSVGVFAGIVEIAVIGYVMVKSMSMIRRRLLIWHQEANEPTTAYSFPAPAKFLFQSECLSDPAPHRL